jgi:hypothetical protein
VIEWTEWSKCSVKCGEGKQTRSRKCDTSDTNCQPIITEQICKMAPCEGMLIPKDQKFLNYP